MPPRSNPQWNEKSVWEVCKVIYIISLFIFLFRKMEDAITARLKKLVTNSNEALEFRLIRNLDDLNSKEAVFKPEMTYQVFGDRFVIINANY